MLISLNSWHSTISIAIGTAFQAPNERLKTALNVVGFALIAKCQCYVRRWFDPVAPNQ